MPAASGADHSSRRDRNKKPENTKASLWGESTHEIYPVANSVRRRFGHAVLQ
jgi:hypothetical protein